MKLYHLRGAVGERALLDSQQDAIEHLLAGDYHPQDLEKLRGHDVYSFRLSGKARLLFTVQRIHGARCLLVLDYLPHHEYSKSRFLKSGLLGRYIEREAASHAASAAGDLLFEPQDE